MFRTRELAFMNLPDYFHATLSSSTTPRRGRYQKYRAQSAVKITFHTDLLNTNIFWSKNAWELRRSQTKGTGGAKAPRRAMLGSTLTCRDINMKMEKQSQAQGIVSSFRDLHVRDYHSYHKFRRHQVPDTFLGYFRRVKVHNSHNDPMR